MSTTLPLVATLTGLIDLTAPDARFITIPDIAHKLATMPRFGGVFETPMSIAQHSVNVGTAVSTYFGREAKIYGLLHDAHEAYLGDITTPVENLLEARLRGFRAHWNNLKLELDIAIREALGVPHPPMAILAAVHSADSRMAATEWRALMPAPNGPWDGAEQPYKGVGIKPLAWPQAEELFTTTLQRELAAKSWELAA